MAGIPNGKIARWEHACGGWTGPAWSGGQGCRVRNGSLPITLSVVPSGERERDARICTVPRPHPGERATRTLKSLGTAKSSEASGGSSSDRWPCHPGRAPDRVRTSCSIRAPYPATGPRLNRVSLFPGYGVLRIAKDVAPTAWLVVPSCPYREGINTFAARSTGGTTFRIWLDNLWPADIASHGSLIIN